MRKIKFRGRSINYVAANDSYWAYGLLVNDDPPEIECDDDIYRVNDNTVGQYTGLKDSNGKEIYEGDIVKVVDDGEESFHVVEYMGNDDYPAFDLVPGLNVDSNGLAYCEHYIDYDVKMYVVGNIYDNPELLKLTKK